MTGPSPEMQRAQQHAAGIAFHAAPQPSGLPQDNPSTRSGAYQRMEKAWQRLRDVFHGTHALRKAGQAYLPKAEAEHDNDYKLRINRTEAFNGLKRTITGLVGMVTRRPPTLSDEADQRIVDDCENIDGAGTAFDVLVGTVLQEGLTTGIVAILVDMPDVPADRTKAQEQALGIRPYWVVYRAEQVVSYRTDVLGGETVLTQIVLEEKLTVPSGRFGEETRQRWRVFRLDGQAVTWEVWEAARNQPPTIVRAGTMGNQTRIPVAVLVLGDRVDYLETWPPLSDLADTVIAHMNVRSDHRYSLHKASVPILCSIGRGDTETPLVVGVNQAVDIPLGGDLKYVEHSGSALAATAQEMTDLKQEMAALGLAMLQQETRSAETAQAKRIDKADQDSALARAARALEDTLEQGMVFHAAYYGAEAPDVSVNRDFEKQQMDAPMVAQLSALVAQNQLSLDTLWQLLQDGSILPRDFDPEEERQKVEDQAVQSLDRQVAEVSALSAVGAPAGPGGASASGMGGARAPGAAPGGEAETPAAPAPDPAIAQALEAIASALSQLSAAPAASTPPAPPTATVNIEKGAFLVNAELPPDEPAPEPAPPPAPTVTRLRILKRDADGRMVEAEIVTEPTKAEEAA